MLLFVLFCFSFQFYQTVSGGTIKPLIPVRLRNFSMKEDNKTAIFEWSNNQTELVELQQEDDECIYRGTFKEDDGSRVLVTGCLGEHRSIQIQSFLHGDTLGTSINGSVELLRGHGDLLTNDTVENNEFIHQFDTEHPEKRVKREYVRNDDFLTDFPASKNANRKIIFPKLLELPIRIYLAPSWRSKFYGGRSKATEVLSHVKELYLHYSLETKFDITYKKSDIFDTSAELSPSSYNLKSLAKFVSAPSSGHAAIVYLTTTAGNNLGIAYPTAICSKDRKTSRSISKWDTSDIYTAQTVAHEIGHNLGFYHDFETTTYDGGRTRACGPGQWNNGPDNDLMNYTPGSELTQNKWSDCSKEDFRNYFSRVTSSEGSTFCLRGEDPELCRIADCSHSDSRTLCPNKCSGPQVILIQSEGEATEYQGERMGFFDLMPDQLNSRPVYGQRGGDNFLYFHTTGTWYVYNILGENRGSLHVVSDAILPPISSSSTPWKYSNYGWFEDPSLELVYDPVEDDSCSSVTVSSSGPAGRTWPDYMGTYRWTGQWQTGRKVFNNGEAFLRILTGKTGWSIGNEKNSGGSGIQGGKTTTCPCSLHAGPTVRFNRKGWAYGDSDGEWNDEDASLTVEC